MSLLDIPDDSVSTLDSWCMAFYREKIGGRVPWNDKSKCPDVDAVRRSVLKRLLADGEKLYDFVLVDEAQDLNAEAFQLLSAMANHITVCADHKQQIYDHGSRISSILKWIGVRRGNVTLLETFRCCPYVVQLASFLIDQENEREAYIRQVRAHQSEREMPIFVHARDAQIEKEHLTSLVRTRLAKGESVAVLFPQQKHAFGYATALKTAGVEVENPKELDFASDKPKLMPYHSAKGLTFDTVILPRLTESAFGRMSLDRILHIVFVGITRAKKWVALIATGNDEFEPLKRILPGTMHGCLTIRNQQANYDFVQTGPSPNDADEDTDGDILDLL